MNARVRALGVAVLKRNAGLRSRYRRSRTRLRSAVSRRHGRGALDAHCVVFESFVGRSYAGSPRALYEAMLGDERFADWRFVWAFRDVDHAGRFPALADARTSIVAFRSAAYYAAFGRAGVWISNSIVAPELRPRTGQMYVQTWHGTPLKRIGLDVVETTETAMNGKAEIDERYLDEAQKVTAFLSAGPFTSQAFASAFALPSHGAGSPFVETGNPRNDELVRATPGDVAGARARLGIAPGQRVLLYAPTWRDDQHDSRSGYVYRQPLDIAALRAAVGEDCVLLFRAHYLITNVVDFGAYGGFVRDVSDVDEINELCLAADVLITDYSSIFFDFALLDRPMVFFMYDLERYEHALRGFYLPVSEVPGPIARTQDELHAALLRPGLDAADRHRRADLNRRMSPNDDGHACRRVLDMVLAPDQRRVGPAEFRIGH